MCADRSRSDDMPGLICLVGIETPPLFFVLCGDDFAVLSDVLAGDHVSIEGLEYL